MTARHLAAALGLSLILPHPAAAQMLPRAVRPVPNYSSSLSKDYLAKLARLPDWNGRWLMTSGDKPRPAEILFDPERFYSPPDPAPAEDEGAGLVGPLPGSYLTDIPYTAEYKKKYQAIVQENLEGRSVDVVAACKPYGFPRVMGGAPSGPEILVTPEVVVMTFDQGSAIRHIYTDGRAHPVGEAFDGGLIPRWNGHSIGHWQGQTLVVDTVGMYPAYFDQTDPPFSDKLHVTERIRLIAPGWLEDQMVLEDPVAFTRPWHVTRYYRRAPQKYPNYGDFNCAPDEQLDVSKGYQSLVLPSERQPGPAK